MEKGKLSILDVFDIKKIGIQAKKTLNWHHGGCTCIDFICLDRRFIPVATKEPLTKTLKCLARFVAPTITVISDQPLNLRKW